MPSRPCPLQPLSDCSESVLQFPSGYLLPNSELNSIAIPSKSGLVSSWGGGIASSFVGNYPEFLNSKADDNFSFYYRAM